MVFEDLYTYIYLEQVNEKRLKKIPSKIQTLENTHTIQTLYIEMNHAKNKFYAK